MSMENDVSNTLYPSRDEIILGLLFCTCSDKKLCDRCPFAGYGKACSHILYINAVRLLYGEGEEE